MILNTPVVSSGLYGFFRRRREAKIRRADEQQKRRDDRRLEHQARMYRRELAYRQRHTAFGAEYPGELPTDRDELICLGAMHLQDGVTLRPSLDSLAPGK